MEIILTITLVAALISIACIVAITLICTGSLKENTRLRIELLNLRKERNKCK